MTLEANNIVFQQRDKYSGTQVNNINQFKDLMSYPGLSFQNCVF